MWNVSASYPQVVCKCAFPEPIGSELASSMSCSNGSNRSSTITWGSCFGLKWRRQKQSWSMCMGLYYIYILDKKKNIRKIWKAHIDTLQILAKFPQITQRSTAQAWSSGIMLSKWGRICFCSHVFISKYFPCSARISFTWRLRICHLTEECPHVTHVLWNLVLPDVQLVSILWTHHEGISVLEKMTKCYEMIKDDKRMLKNRWSKC